MFAVPRGAAAFAAAGMLVSLATAPPAGAAAGWSAPDIVGGWYGWQVQVSADGDVAAWIQTGSARGPGPVHTSEFRPGDGTWTDSRQLPGSAEADELLLGVGGDTILFKTAAGYAVSSRVSGNKWTRAELLVPGVCTSVLATGVESCPLTAKMSADGRTVAWIELRRSAADPRRLGRFVMSRHRLADGTWAGKIPMGQASRTIAGGNQFALSGDGSAAAWLDREHRLVVADRGGRRSWRAPAAVDMSRPRSRLPTDVQLSADGSRLTWRRGRVAVVTSRRSATGWAPPVPVFRGQVDTAAVSPGGTVIAYARRDLDELRVRRYRSGRWTPSKALGPARGPDIVVRNRGVAWVERRARASTLRVSDFVGGRWREAAVLDSEAQSPALSRTANTLAWAAMDIGRVLGVKRRTTLGPSRRGTAGGTIFPDAPGVRWK